MLFMNDGNSRITDQVVGEAMSKADACQISVLRRMVGLPVRGRTGARIDRTLEALGIRGTYATRALTPQTTQPPGQGG